MAKPDNAGAASTDYMHLFGLVALGYMWALMAKAAVEKRDSGADGKEEFLASKLLVGKFYMERIMPETSLRKTRIETGSDTMMELAAEAF
jgi:acyl-CoA dehydrogenase